MAEANKSITADQYAGSVVELHINGEINAVVEYEKIYAECMEGNQSEFEFIRRCAVLDFDDWESNASVFQERVLELLASKEPKFDASEITAQSVLGALYREEISTDDAVARLKENSPEKLAEFIVDAFNRGWITRFNLGLDDEGLVI